MRVSPISSGSQPLAGKAGVFSDTSVWSPVDLLDFYRKVPPEQIVWASDYPYGQEPNSLLNGVRSARIAGFDESQLRQMLWENASRMASGEPPLEPSTPIGGDTFSQPMQLARIHGYLSMAMPLLWTRQADSFGVLGLALNACLEKNGVAEPADQIRELLETARDLWRSLPEEEEQDRLAVGSRDHPPDPPRGRSGGHDARLTTPGPR